MQLRVNGEVHDIPDSLQNETLLTVLREHLGLVGAKHGCGVGVCGTCTIHIDGVAERSCVIQVAAMAEAEIVTIEGLADDKGNLHPVQQAWLDERVVQCGFCQAGQIMQAVALLEQTPLPDNAAVADTMSSNLCRCGTQSRIRRAIHRAAEKMRDQHD